MLNVAYAIKVFFSRLIVDILHFCVINHNRIFLIKHLAFASKKSLKFKTDVLNQPDYFLALFQQLFFIGHIQVLNGITVMILVHQFDGINFFRRVEISQHVK